MTVIVYPMDWSGGCNDCYSVPNGLVPEGAMTVRVYPVDWPEGAMTVIVYPMDWSGGCSDCYSVHNDSHRQVNQSWMPSVD